MKKNIFLPFIILLILGCGAQNNPSQEDIIGSNLLTMSESQDLPTTINLDFPIILTETSNNPLFNSDIQHINAVIDLSKQQLRFLEQIMPNIIQECNNLNRCSFPKNHFLVQDNGQTIPLGKIEFLTGQVNLTTNYQLIVELNTTESLTFKWIEDKSDVITIYRNQNATLSLRYLSNFQTKEAMIIQDIHLQAQSDYFILLNGSKYHFSSNHIKNDFDSFSSNIKLEEDLILEYNENVFTLNFTKENLKEGTYLLLPSNTKIEGLKLIKALTLAEGIFSLFNGEIQGFLYKNDFIDRSEALSLLRVTF